MRRWYRPSNRRIFVSSVKPAVCRSNGKPVGGCTRTPTRGGKRAYTRTRARRGARHRCAPLGQILQTILAFAPIFFPREKDGEDTRAKGREKMNLRSKLTRRSPTLLEHLSSVTFAARIIITSVESIRFVFLLLLRGWDTSWRKSPRHRCVIGGVVGCT